jgi:two-component system response regulator MprA
MANVLVVDDEPDVLDALARAIRLAGHKVTKASDAADALRRCEDHSFDVVVLDYIMPSMSGIELLNRIRDYQPTIRSVIVSGKIDTQLSEDAVVEELRDRIEADAYLHKPLNNQRLLDTINVLLNENEKRSWKDVAKLNVTAKKRKAEVKGAERAMSRLKASKRR